MCSDLTKTLILAFWRTLFKGGLHNLRDNSYAQDPAIRARSDDLGLISRSQVCQIHTLQGDFRFLSTVV